MRFFLPAVLIVGSVGMALTGCFWSRDAASWTQEYTQRGTYDVGMRPLFFHDPDRPFDWWNARHGSDGYLAASREIGAAGERQIVAAHVWYPAAGDDARSQTPAADGRFPIVVLAHGLGGYSLLWDGFAEYLASHGYVVVAPSFVSDSSQPRVFESPDSRFAQTADAQTLDRVYRTIQGEPKVIPRFYAYFFEPEGSTRAGARASEGLRAVPGGGNKVGEMMGEFFTQRVDDVASVIDGLRSLNAGKATCLAEYTARGQPIHGADVCGLFSGALDLDRIGIAGHSLGSMTAQFAVERIDALVAAVGYNNGPPRYWEPPGIFGGGLAADGQPAGNSQPVMQIHGSEDDFVQGVFRGLMWNTLSAAGGNPEDIWVLEAERELPSDQNPQPIARNAYTRATGDKVIVLVKDLDHDALLGEFSSAARSRKAVGADVLDPSFRGESFTPLAWGVVDGVDVFMPTFIRNYYTKNWFDYYLKGDDQAARFVEDPIAELGILDVRYELPGR